jgi:hypothetical protein
MSFRDTDKTHQINRLLEPLVCIPLPVPRLPTVKGSMIGDPVQATNGAVAGDAESAENGKSPPANWALLQILAPDSISVPPGRFEIGEHVPWVGLPARFERCGN